MEAKTRQFMLFAFHNTTTLSRQIVGKQEDNNTSETKYSIRYTRYDIRNMEICQVNIYP